MFPMNTDPYTTTTIARYRIEDRLREAEAHRLAAQARRGASTEPRTPRTKPHWSAAFVRRGFLTWAKASRLGEWGR